MKKLIIILAVLTVLLTACTQPISEIKNDEHIGKTVQVHGIVQGSIKLGQLSAYSLKDESGQTIGVSSQRLPADGDEVTVKGVLLKDTIFGYYIKAAE